MAAGVSNIPVSQSSHEKAAILALPDFSADWQMPLGDATNAEIKARFYYEFARESQTVLTLTETLGHFSSGEILRASRSTLRYPGAALNDLHPFLEKITLALMPTINLRDVSWNHLEPEQRASLIRAFARGPAFRDQYELELLTFIDERLSPKKPAVGTTQPDIYPRWFGSSQLFWDGVERVAICIDWSQGPQTIKAAMEQWFQRHKRALARLKLRGRLPGSAHGSHYFCLRDETGAKNPRQKYFTALRGLGAMRLLGTYTLLEAIEITKGSGRNGDSLFSGFVDPDTRKATGRSAWDRGITKARQTFHDLFYRYDEYSLHLRRCGGLPEIEEPISYQRYRLRREK